MGLPTMFPMIGGHEGSGIVREVGTASPISPPATMW